MAFFMCCTLLVLGNPMPDGSSDCLSLPDLVACIEGGKQLMYADMEAPVKVFRRSDGWDEDCENSGFCRTLCSAGILSYYMTKRVIGSWFRLGPWEEHSHWFVSLLGDVFCEHCARHLREKAMKEVLNNWNHLPDYFAIDRSIIYPPPFPI